MLFPPDSTVREKMLRATTCGSFTASSSEDTMAQHMSSPANAFRHSSAVRQEMATSTVAGHLGDSRDANDGAKAAPELALDRSSCEEATVLRAIDCGSAPSLQ